MITSKKDPIEVLKQSLAYKTRKVDTVALNEYHYINSACFGVDSIIANHVRDIIQIPLVPQSKSYIVSIMQHIFQYQFDEVTIYSEGKCLYEGSVTLCALNNGQYYGGGFPITSNASIQDGYFDICVVEKVPYAKMPHLLTLLFKRKLDKRKEVHSFRVKEAEVVCGNSCNLDGEEVKCQNYQFKIDPLSLNMVIFK